jgi:hypothetical protein
MNQSLALIVLVAVTALIIGPVQWPQASTTLAAEPKTMKITQEHASRFAKLALKGIRKEYPN